MAGSGFKALCFGYPLLFLLFLLGVCEESAEIWGAGEAKGDGRQKEKERIEVLKEVLEKLRNGLLLTIGKKFSWVPSCDAGEPCAVRKGARFGRLCNCPRGTSCSVYILKCL
ncbi:cocaine- and amphetamine-regulated transcript protein-like [Sceloporus undulatus]|uniref:cocaine- and amphetamine-regulated transcript protein-like n=1 Tax=Sceloporus undulatus TaxID=8520 RepID=UPI001C4D95CA|nr:cocaine- and amphetamine-regulated transcript protein-like [Sceloporus undulatus]